LFQAFLTLIDNNVRKWGNKGLIKAISQNL